MRNNPPEAAEKGHCWNPTRNHNGEKEKGD